MSKREKAIEKLRQNSKKVRFEEIETILIGIGFTMRQNGTSHAVFTYDKYRLTVPHRKPFVLSTYVKQVLAVIDELGLEEAESDRELEQPNQD